MKVINETQWVQTILTFDQLKKKLIESNAIGPGYDIKKIEIENDNLLLFGEYQIQDLQNHLINIKGEK